MERYRFSYAYLRQPQYYRLHAPGMTWACSSDGLERLTPVQRFRQADPS
jgi:hypothetical protein